MTFIDFCNSSYSLAMTATPTQSISHAAKTSPKPYNTKLDVSIFSHYINWGSRVRKQPTHELFPQRGLAFDISLDNWGPDLDLDLGLDLTWIWTWIRTWTWIWTWMCRWTGSGPQSLICLISIMILNNVIVSNDSAPSSVLIIFKSEDSEPYTFCWTCF